MSMFSTGTINFNANHMLIDLGSGLLSGDIPGTGPLETFELNVLQGDIVTNVMAGTFEVYAANEDIISKIILQVGDLLSPTTIVNSNITMSCYKTKIVQTVIPFLTESSLELGEGEATLDSSLGTNISSKLNVDIASETTMVSIDAPLEVSISSDAKVSVEAMMDLSMVSQMMMELKAMIMDIQSQMITMKADMITIEGSVLDMSGSTMINMGSGMVAPTGSGPLCAIPVCPFSGMPHIGGISVG